MTDPVERSIEQLLSVKNARPGTEVTLPEEDIMWLCRKCREVSGAFFLGEGGLRD